MNCAKCGKCCLLRIGNPATGEIYETQIRCPYLTKDNLCSVYDNRPDWCMTAEQMRELNILPNECALKGG